MSEEKQLSLTMNHNRFKISQILLKKMMQLWRQVRGKSEGKVKGETGGSVKAEMEKLIKEWMK